VSTTGSLGLAPSIVLGGDEGAVEAGVGAGPERSLRRLLLRTAAAGVAARGRLGGGPGAGVRLLAIALTTGAEVTTRGDPGGVVSGGGVAAARSTREGGTATAAMPVVDMAAAPLTRDGDVVSQRVRAGAAAMRFVKVDMAALSLVIRDEPRIAAMP